MEFINYNNLPKDMQNKDVYHYYAILKQKRKYLKLKRMLDVLVASGLITASLVPMILIAYKIKKDSNGKVFFTQKRITQYGKEFTIYKFRTMKEVDGANLTTKNDKRVTKIGKVLRKYRLDELPQLFNILKGDMTFVGTRPEVSEYVEKYDDKMRATLLLPAGVTSYASIKFRNEEKLLSNKENVDEVYIKEILPKKMKYNLCGLKNTSLKNDISIVVRTILAVFL